MSDMQLIVPGEARVPIQVVVLFSASVGAVRFLWKALRRGPSPEAELPQKANGATRHLWRLYAETWDELCKWDPINATMNGDNRNNNRLADLGEDARKNHVKKLRDIEKRLQNVNYKDLRPETEQMNFQFLREHLRLELRAKETFDIYELPTNHMFGPHILITQLPAIQRIRNGGEAKAFIQRLRAFDHQSNQIIEALRAGIKKGVTMHLQAIQTMIQQCQAQVVDTSAESGLYQMTAARVRSVGGNVDQLKGAIEECVIPGFQRLTTFLKDVYVWEARKEAGIWCVPSGDSIYRGCAEYFTSLDLSPQELHELGLAEVDRITDKIHKVRRLLGEDDEESDLDYVGRMRENPLNHFTKSSEILDRYTEIIEKAQHAMPYFFDNFPAGPLLVRSIDEQQAAFAPPAHYNPASPSENQPAVFFANTSKPETRPKYQMVAVALHEGIPGHHIQLGLAQSMSNIPRLRRAESLCSLSFVQGWALYGEYLGEVMGFYEDPRDYFGRLLTEIRRASRLVVDTGIHSQKWTREFASEYMKNHAFLGESDVMSEIDRIISMPGQAVAYKVGERRLLELKEFAERKLEGKFTWPAFHDIVLRSGTVPLSIVDSNVTQWVSRERKNLSQRRSSQGTDSFQRSSRSSDGSNLYPYNRS